MYLHTLKILIIIIKIISLKLFIQNHSKTVTITSSQKH